MVQEVINLRFIHSRYNSYGFPHLATDVDEVENFLVNYVGSVGKWGLEVVEIEIELLETQRYYILHPPESSSTKTSDIVKFIESGLFFAL